MSKSTRHVAREKAILAVYQYLTVNASPEEIDQFLHTDNWTVDGSQEEVVLLDGRSGMEFCQFLISHTIENNQAYIDLISRKMRSDWTFDRLSKMVQAILLVAVCELLETDTVKNIVINEAVIFAKDYCDDQEYKFINGILGKVV